MDIIEVSGKVYGVVITQDDAGAEIGLWCGDEQVAALLVDEEGISSITERDRRSPGFSSTGL